MYFLISNPEANLLATVGASGLARESSARADLRGIASSENSCDHAQVSVVTRTFASNAVHKYLSDTSIYH
jgi:hypothetical protein